MAILMTKLCEKGVDLIWRQCDEELYPEGLHYLEEAAANGDPEGWFFMGHCYSWGDGAVGFNEKKAYYYYKKAAEAGSFRAVLGAARAGLYDAGIKKTAIYTLEESYEEVLSAAEQGEAFAAYQIAAAYEWETVFELLSEEERTPGRCFYWYKKAAEGGIVDAMVKVGKCYLNGQYIPKDPKQAMEWADRAASRGHVWGLYQMGLSHIMGENWEAANVYFEAAAKQGDLRAWLYLGRMYLNGQGTEQDLEKAVEALEKAASAGVVESFSELGHIFYQNELVEHDDEKAFYWYDRAHHAGRHEAALPLAQLYLKTAHVENCRRAEELLKEAVTLETEGQASLILGNIKRNGLSGEIDMEEAVSWYERGARQGNTECMEILGLLYFEGEDVLENDYEKAFYWLSLSREAGTLQACSKLAYLYLKGEGCEADEEQAIALFEKAAETEYDGYALYELGYLYERRNESPEDLNRAADYYQKAIERGYEGASRRFSHFKKNLFGKWKVTY